MQNTRLLLVLFLFLLSAGVVAEESTESTEDILRQKTRLLRSCPKRFAAFRGADPSRGEVELLMEGEKDPRVWKIDADAEIKIHGYWGRLEDLRAGDRTWAWIRLDRQKRPVSLFMLADEISEQTVHNLPFTLDSVDPEKRTIVLERKGDEPRTLSLDKSLRVLEEKPGVFVIASSDEASPHQSAARLSPGDPVYVQTTGKSARIVLGSDGLDRLRERQRSRLRERWRREGLPATVAFLHRFAGEVEVVLDHEAMRWGRHLKPGDGAAIQLADPVRSLVLEVRPWCERTCLRLAARGPDLSDLSPGLRVFIRVDEPPAEVLSSKLPADIGRQRSPAERIEWFLSSTYCSCSIAGDGCTGMFYTLAGCNPKACGMPKRIREMVGPLIDQGLTDRDIFTKLEEERGQLIFQQHLLR